MAPHRVLPHMGVLAKDQQGETRCECPLICRVTDEAAHAVRQTGFPGAAAAILPSDVAAHGSDCFSSLAEGFEIHM
jgi:hypothetical protein